MGLRIATFLIPLILIIFGGIWGRSGHSLVIQTNAGRYRLSVEMADTDETRKMGLMGREKLREDTGMLFVYDHEAHPIIWMKNMLIPLDILFIGDNGTINHIEEAVPPCMAEDDSQCALYFADQPSGWVLELSAGYAEKHQVEVGDQVLF